MPAPRKPQDRKPKADAAFKFTHKVGTTVKTFTLPSARVGAKKVKGQILRDAAMDGTPMAQMRLGIAMLEACGATQEAIDALYDKDAGDMSTLLEAWMNRADGEGTVPQS